MKPESKKECYFYLFLRECDIIKTDERSHIVLRDESKE